jgi:hypothetical protein
LISLDIVQESLDEQGIISEEQEIGRMKFSLISKSEMTILFLGRNTGQKRTIEVICDDSQRYIV